jgi:demethylmenaquinone methyltransferase/2-methoxy-6-polyprenyl-1,4-benzoquinol methylase
MDADRFLSEQIDYYRARAPEYDQWFLRQGRYDRGPESSRRWFEEVDTVRGALAQFRPAGHVLELACGTGWWTAELARTATRVTALDAAQETLALNRQRVQSPKVEYGQADIFEWQPSRPDERFDAVFFGFWLSHVPPRRFDRFWDRLRGWLAEDGRVFFVDSRREPTSTASNHQLPEQESIVSSRKLNDGREFSVYKIFYDSTELADRLHGIGWNAQLQMTPSYFIYGTAAPDRC